MKTIKPFRSNTIPVFFLMLLMLLVTLAPIMRVHANGGTINLRLVKVHINYPIGGTLYQNWDWEYRAYGGLCDGVLWYLEEFPYCPIRAVNYGESLRFDEVTGFADWYNSHPNERGMKIFVVESAYYVYEGGGYTIHYGWNDGSLWDSTISGAVFGFIPNFQLNWWTGRWEFVDVTYMPRAYIANLVKHTIGEGSGQPDCWLHNIFGVPCFLGTAGLPNHDDMCSNCYGAFRANIAEPHGWC